MSTIIVYIILIGKPIFRKEMRVAIQMLFESGDTTTAMLFFERSEVPSPLQILFGIKKTCVFDCIFTFLSSGILAFI